MKNQPSLMDLYRLIKEEKETKYTIYCDLDGVLVDFDKGYYELTGKPTHHADVQDKQEFWKTLHRGLASKNMEEREYWSNLEWMPDGKELFKYILPYNPFILTAPSRDPGSKIGKTEWVNENLSGVKKLIFAAAYKKPSYSRKNHILIDDRKQTIDEWNTNGGIGIFHTSAKDTIKQLKKLSL